MGPLSVTGRPGKQFLLKIAVLVFALLAAARAVAAGDYTLSGSSKWVVIASREQLAEAIGIAEIYRGQKSQIFKSENGWYAVVLGPYAKRTINDFRASYSGPDLPSDAYLARGSNFVSKVWPSGQAKAATQTAGSSSSDSRWVVIASREQLAEAIGIAEIYRAQKSQIFKSENGWYAVVLGPYAKRTIDDFRAGYSGPDLPSDAYLARGSNFLSKVWSSGQTEAATQTASFASPRAFHFGNVQLEYNFPSSFQYLGRSRDSVYFGDGEAVIEFTWVSFYSDGMEGLMAELKSMPTYNREDGYFKDDIDFLIMKEEIKGNRAWVDWSDGASRYSRISYAVAGCCENYIRFTLERPTSVSVSDWLQDFYDSFRKGQGTRYSDDDSRADWTLPRASTPARSEAEKLYDACSRNWNDKSYGGQMGFKAMGAYMKGSKGWCRWATGYASAAAAWASVVKGCEEDGAVDCHRFALGNDLSEWADKQKSAAGYGSRDRDYRNAQVASRPAAPPPSNSGGGGGSALNDLLDIGGALLNGWNQGQAIGRALDGGGGGYSGGGGGGGGGGNKAAVCAQLRNNADICRQRQMGMGGGTTPGTQAGSFFECYKEYTNAAIARGC